MLILTLRLVSTDISKPSPPSTWKDLIPHHASDVLEGCVALKGDYLVAK
jgi:hypothetical protein